MCGHLQKGDGPQHICSLGSRILCDLARAHSSYVSYPFQPCSSHFALRRGFTASDNLTCVHLHQPSIAVEHGLTRGRRSAYEHLMLGARRPVGGLPVGAPVLQVANTSQVLVGRLRLNTCLGTWLSDSLSHYQDTGPNMRDPASYRPHSLVQSS